MLSLKERHRQVDRGAERAGVGLAEGSLSVAEYGAVERRRRRHAARVVPQRRQLALRELRARVAIAMGRLSVLQDG